MPPVTSAAQVRERLLALLEPLVGAAGYDLEDVSVSAAGRRSVVRVFVDADGGVDLDAVATVSRVVSDALDERDSDFGGAGLLGGAYVLEVSSPGVDRPLTEPRHWRRAAGRLVERRGRGQGGHRPGRRHRRRRGHPRDRRGGAPRAVGAARAAAASRSSSTASEEELAMVNVDIAGAAQHRAGEGDLLRAPRSTRSRPPC